ncbi:FeoB-associated Cys-rich membrane protein [Massilia sp. TS11]|uniref:FeoB-associated Cys-rich membrane protein n=1 Tax=Massilia sp. TS11 TaxID=2908003 RepID=UPI001EDA9AD2|nr:FeoB-associated Cys-rich membrane protein [Massilia sp. TS11]MCG2586699.1 FeoB-associated Cys-rich membrane protein [Massilia sp. TS11]
MQTLVTALIILAAAVYAGRRWLFKRKAKDCASGCGGCASGCSTPPAAADGRRTIPIRPR